MEKWVEKVHKINTYNPECKDVMDYYYNTNLSENISPLTKFFLNTFVNTMEQKNIIVTFADNILRPLPLIAYTYSFLKNKSTLIFTSNTKGLEKKSPREIHNLNYYMLNWDGEYLFYDIPIGYVFKDKIEAKIQMPLANRKFKKKYVEHLKQNFIETDYPKILLYADNSTKIVDYVNGILLDNNTKFKKQMRFELGCIIFENVDRYVNSKYTSKQFVNWIKEYMNTDINFVFHFSNPSSPFINFIQKNTNSFVIPFNKGILTNNKGIGAPSLDYYDNISSSEEKIIEKYNLDRPYFYNDNKDIHVFEPLIEPGNIDYYFLEAKNLLKRVEEKKIRNKKLYYRSLGLLYTLQDLIINPSKYKIRYGDYEIGWRFFTIPTFLEMFQNRLSKENSFNQLVLAEYITQLDNIYSEISKCKRFGEESSYNRIGKDCKIIEIAQNKNDVFNEDHTLMIGAYSNSESSVLRGELEKFGIDNVKVRHVGWLNKSNFDRSDYNLLLPGPLPVKYFSELLRSYKKILVLAYNGYNFNRIKDQIKLVSEYSISEEIVSMNYFKEIYDYVGIPKNDSLFTDYHDRLDKLEVEKEPISDGTSLHSFDKIKKLVTTESSDYEEDLDNLGRMIKNIKVEDKKAYQNVYSETLEFSLLNLENGRKYRKSLPVEKTYFFLKNIGGKIEEGSPKDLKPGNFIIVIDNDEKKTLLQLIIEIYDLESSIDKEIIEFWKERLMLFIKDTRIKYRQLYEIYTNLGGQKHYQTVLNWAKGKVIGPEDQEDLHYIGKILDEKIIEDNFELISDEIEKVRNIHRTTGKKLKNVIKAIIFEGKALDPQNLSYEEYLFYEKVKNGIYEILEIR